MFPTERMADAFIPVALGHDHRSPMDWSLVDWSSVDFTAFRAGLTPELRASMQQFRDDLERERLYGRWASIAQEIETYTYAGGRLGGVVVDGDAALISCLYERR